MSIDAYINAIAINRLRVGRLARLRVGRLARLRVGRLVQLQVLVPVAGSRLGGLAQH